MSLSTIGDSMTHPPTNCHHVRIGYCVLCKAASSPKCIHGNPFFCGHCGTVERDGQTPKPNPAV